MIVLITGFISNSELVKRTAFSFLFWGLWQQSLQWQLKKVGKMLLNNLQS
jgi:hypothetical protein